MLFNEPKLLKSRGAAPRGAARGGFSALQRAEIAEIQPDGSVAGISRPVSVLFNEPKLLKFALVDLGFRCPECFSALQRAEIAEIAPRRVRSQRAVGFSALQRAEIAEMQNGVSNAVRRRAFQCSSTSRNC